MTVQITQQDRTAPLSVHCSCGMQYQVETDARRHPRKHAQLPGVYMDLEDETQKGPMVVEDISFGGIRFRITAPHTIACNACLHIQFTLDDAAYTCVWEQVLVRYMHGDTIGAEFLDMDVFNKGLAAYVKS